MDLDLIEKLLRLLANSTAEELEVSENGVTIRMAKHRTEAPAQSAASPRALPAEPVPAPLADGTAVPLRAETVEVKAGMTGIFYRSPSPEARPFVEQGDRVRDGQTLCLLEAMKTFNPVEAEMDGVIREILAEEGVLVEAGTPLFRLSPV